VRDQRTLPANRGTSMPMTSTMSSKPAMSGPSDTRSLVRKGRLWRAPPLC
jgi:hypothetical protein